MDQETKPVERDRPVVEAPEPVRYVLFGGLALAALSLVLMFVAPFRSRTALRRRNGAPD
jgi:hypothetical protein